jgi:hypothetical protein
LPRPRARRASVSRAVRGMGASFLSVPAGLEGTSEPGSLWVTADETQGDGSRFRNETQLTTSR